MDKQYTVNFIVNFLLVTIRKVHENSHFYFNKSISQYIEHPFCTLLLAHSNVGPSHLMLGVGLEQLKEMKAFKSYMYL